MPAFCQSCSTPIDEAMELSMGRQPCPNCGSLGRRFEELVSDTAVMGSMIATKGYAGGLPRRKGIRFESKDGDSYSVDRRRFVKLTQLVDHENYRYIKKVVDPTTGEVIRDVDEHLSEHRGRGSAKDRDT